MRILVIDDDKFVVDALTRLLERTLNCNVVAAHTAEDGLRLFRTLKPDAVVLDWVLSPTRDEPNGLAVCREIRAESPQVGIVFFTGKSALQDKLDALGAGADDYVTKPCEPDELLARVRTVLRRTTSSSPPRPDPVVSSGDDSPSRTLSWREIAIDLVEQTVTVMGMPVDLPRRQFLLLVHLVRNVGRPTSQSEIREKVFRTAAASDSSSIRNHISELRSRLGWAGRYVQCLRGEGYGLEILTTEEDVEPS